MTTLFDFLSSTPVAVPLAAHLRAPLPPPSHYTSLLPLLITQTLAGRGGTSELVASHPSSDLTLAYLGVDVRALDAALSSSSTAVNLSEDLFDQFEAASTFERARLVLSSLYTPSSSHTLLQHDLVTEHTRAVLGIITPRLKSFNAEVIVPTLIHHTGKKASRYIQSLVGGAPSLLVPVLGVLVAQLAALATEPMQATNRMADLVGRIGECVHALVLFSDRALQPLRRMVMALEAPQAHAPGTLVPAAALCTRLALQVTARLGDVVAFVYSVLREVGSSERAPTGTTRLPEGLVMYLQYLGQSQEPQPDRDVVGRAFQQALENAADKAEAVQTLHAHLLLVTMTRWPLREAEQWQRLAEIAAAHRPLLLLPLVLLGHPSIAVEQLCDMLLEREPRTLHLLAARCHEGQAHYVVELAADVLGLKAQHVNFHAAHIGALLRGVRKHVPIGRLLEMLLARPPHDTCWEAAFAVFHSPELQSTDAPLTRLGAWVCDAIHEASRTQTWPHLLPSVLEVCADLCINRRVTALERADSVAALDFQLLSADTVRRLLLEVPHHAADDDDDVVMLSASRAPVEGRCVRSCDPAYLYQLLPAVYYVLYYNSHLDKARREHLTDVGLSQLELSGYDSEPLFLAPLTGLLLFLRQDPERHKYVYPPFLSLLLVAHPEAAVIADDESTALDPLFGRGNPVPSVPPSLELTQALANPQTAGGALQAIYEQNVESRGECFHVDTVMGVFVPAMLRARSEMGWSLGQVFWRLWCLWLRRLGLGFAYETLLGVWRSRPSRPLLPSILHVVQDPLLALGICEDVEESVHWTRIFLRVIQPVFVASNQMYTRLEHERVRAMQLTHGSGQVPPTFANLKSDVDPREMERHAHVIGTLLLGQQSACVQWLLEMCLRHLRRAARTTSLEERGRRHEICGLVFAFVHRSFLEKPLVMKLVHYQGYPAELIPAMVEAVPSMHGCLDYLGEMLQHRSQVSNVQQLGDGHFIFLCHLLGQLAKKYPIPRSFSLCSELLDRFVAQQGGALIFRQTKWWLSSIPSSHKAKFLAAVEDLGDVFGGRLKAKVAQVLQVLT